MNDRYLFKAKRKMWKKFPENEHWIIWDAITGKPREAILNETICQCTGSKDKNGNLIWENDIVKNHDGTTAVVVWSEHLSAFLVDYIQYGAQYILDAGYINRLKIEVIGNVFDNFELLEVE